MIERAPLFLPSFFFFFSFRSSLWPCKSARPKRQRFTEVNINFRFIICLLVELFHSHIRPCFPSWKRSFQKRGGETVFFLQSLSRLEQNKHSNFGGGNRKGGGIYIYRSGGRCDFGSHTLEWRWRAEFQMRGTRLHNWPPVVFCVSCFSPEKEKNLRQDVILKRGDE